MEIIWSLARRVNLSSHSLSLSSYLLIAPEDVLALFKMEQWIQLIVMVTVENELEQNEKKNVCELMTHKQSE